MKIKARWVLAGVMTVGLGAGLAPIIGRYDYELARREEWVVKRVGSSYIKCPGKKSKRAPCKAKREIHFVPGDGERKRTIDIEATCLTARPRQLLAGTKVPVDIYRYSMFGMSWHFPDRQKLPQSTCQAGATELERSIAAQIYQDRLQVDIEFCDRNRGGTAPGGLPCRRLGKTGAHVTHYYESVLPRLSMPPSLPFPTSGTFDQGWIDPTLHPSEKIKPEGQLQIWDATRSPENKVVHLHQIHDENMYIETEPHTVYLKAGGRTVIELRSGTRYRITAVAGHTWYGERAQFGPNAPAADLGEVSVSNTEPAVIALGAQDQKATAIPASRF